MDETELDQLIDEVERSTAMAALDNLVALCTAAELERALAHPSGMLAAAGEHFRLYGHKLAHGCCLRAYEAGQPSLCDEAVRAA